MPYGAFGLRRTLDASQRFFRAGLPVYLRMKNFNDNPIWADLGLTFTPTTPNTPIGTQDFSINPPPDINILGMHSLAMAQASGFQLRAGARKVNISHTWVLMMQNMLQYSIPQQVFNDPHVVGIVTDNLLLEVVTMSHEDAFGEVIQWNLLCNASEYSGA